MNIQEVAVRTGLSAHTIRFYEKSGILPQVARTASGNRNFSETDVTFLQFVSALRKTGMALADIAEFTADGCILERLKTGEMPADPVTRRMALLQKHRGHLQAQRAEIDLLLDAVDQKLQFYEDYLSRTMNTEKS